MYNESSVLINFLSSIKKEMVVTPPSRSYHGKHYDLNVSIGKYHYATLTIDEEALLAICDEKGCDINDFIGDGNE